MLLNGILEHGTYLESNHQDDCTGLNLDQILQSYGVNGTVRQQEKGQTGAGHSSEDLIDIVSNPHIDSDDENDFEIDSERLKSVFGGKIAESSHCDSVYDSEFNAEAVKVPRVVDPFSDSPLCREIFERSFGQVCQQKIIPSGYNILIDEWDDSDSYPSYWFIKSGRRGTRQLKVDLPDEIWHPRGEKWVQALDVYNHIFA